VIKKDKHKGETAYIIGKGKSLIHFNRSNIGDGVVIAIAESIVPIEALEIPAYSLQKDGGWLKRYPASLDPACDSRDCDNCRGMVRPQKAILLVHDLEARYCFKDYSPRHVFTLEEIGQPHNEFSLVCAIKIAQLMGCEKFKFVSCDAHAVGDYDVYVPGLGINTTPGWHGIEMRNLKMQRELIKPYLEGTDYEWITPKG